MILIQYNNTTNKNDYLCLLKSAGMLTLKSFLKGLRFDLSNQIDFYKNLSLTYFLEKPGPGLM